jgi:hypothetical protein
MLDLSSRLYFIRMNVLSLQVTRTRGTYRDNSSWTTPEAFRNGIAFTAFSQKYQTPFCILRNLAPPFEPLTKTLGLNSPLRSSRSRLYDEPTSSTAASSGSSPGDPGVGTGSPIVIAAASATGCISSAGGEGTSAHASNRSQPV